MGIKSIIKRAILGPPGQKVRRVRGGVLRGALFPIDLSNETQRYLGLWEREIASDVRMLANEASIACDVGANTGWYALFFATLPHMERVFAFEGDPAFMPIIAKNLQLNGDAMVQKTTTMAKFVGDVDDSEKRWCKLDTVLKDVAGASPTATIMLKIDVDGGELEVLKGARQTLTHHRCNVVIETHSPELERDCVAFLEQLGYRTRIVKNAWYRPIIPENRTIPHNRWMTAVKN
jgi:FkbM family methyltransferase